MISARHLAAAVTAVAFTFGAAAAQETASRGRDRVPFAIPAVTDTVTLDGAVTEAVWERALTLELRYEVRPGENIPPPVRTEVLLAHDDRSLFVAFKAADPEPRAIRARFNDRDKMWDDDFVGIVLDTFNDERRAFEFFANPLGVQGDMLMDDVSGDEDSAWNAIWSSAGRLTAGGFEVEMVIPFTQLRFQASAGPQLWGIDGIRSYPRRDRHHIGLFPRIRGENSYLGQEEKLSGFGGVRPGQNLEVVPTLTALKSDERENFPHGRLANIRNDTDFGLSAKWGLTPNVTLNATFNPDFSQIEADVAQLDLNNTFELFYDETRPFFLESADFFRTTRLNLLYTRQVIQPNGAVKISGKSGRQAFGFFSALDETTAVVVPGVQGSTTHVLDQNTLATAGRYRFDVGSTSTIGGLVTDRRGENYFNSVAAFDTRHRFSPSDSVGATIALSMTRDTPEIAGVTNPGRHADHGLEVQYNHSVRTWDAYAQYRDHGTDFRSDLGFTTQTGIRRVEAGASRTWHGDSTRFYNRINVNGNFDQTDEQDGALYEREYEAYINYNGPRETYAQWGGGQRTRVHNGVAFDQWFQSANAEIRLSRSLYFGSRVNWGDWIDFDHTRPARQLTVRPFVNVNYGRHLSLKYTHIYDRLDVQGGQLFAAHLPELRIVYQHDTRTLFRAILQYTGVARDALLYADPVDSESRDLFAQLLFSYKVNAQTAVYVGYTSGATGTHETALTTANRTLFGKLSYAWLR